MRAAVDSFSVHRIYGYEVRHGAHIGITVPNVYWSKAVRFTEDLEGRF
jgi:hypothetical protein